MAVKANSHAARILRALSDGKWHTTAKLQRASGHGSLSSRISELRGRGYVIEHQRLPKHGTLGHRYRLVDGPEIPATPEEERPTLDRDSVPRTPEHRFRIYRQRYDELELVGTAPSEQALGSVLINLGKQGQFAESCVGLLDTYGTDEVPGTWIISPWDVAP